MMSTVMRPLPCWLRRALPRTTLAAKTKASETHHREERCYCRGRLFEPIGQVTPAEFEAHWRHQIESEYSDLESSEVETSGTVHPGSKTLHEDALTSVRSQTKASNKLDVIHLSFAGPLDLYVEEIDIGSGQFSAAHENLSAFAVLVTAILTESPPGFSCGEPV
jgi:hypothetical protein